MLTWVMTFDGRIDEQRPGKIKEITGPHATPKKDPHTRDKQIVHWPVTEEGK